MRSIVLPLIACALAFTVTGAQAERADREKKIVVGADRGIADDANRTSTFEGAVVITQGTMRITASKVTVKEDKDRNKYYVANGTPVTFRQKRDNADEWIEGFADRAEFDDQNDVLKLIDHARVKRNNDELTGDLITYDMRKELAEISGAPAGQALPSTGRVKAILLPPKKAPGSDKAAPEKAAPGITLKPDGGTP